jgi:hypothetical protein
VRWAALATLGRAAEAATSLRGAIGRDPTLRERAQRDPDFDALRDRPDFRAAVGE